MNTREVVLGIPRNLRGNVYIKGATSPVDTKVWTLWWRNFMSDSRILRDHVSLKFSAPSLAEARSALYWFAVNRKSITLRRKIVCALKTGIFYVAFVCQDYFVLPMITEDSSYLALTQRGIFELQFLVTNHSFDTARRYYYGNALDIIHGWTRPTPPPRL